MFTNIIIHLNSANIAVLGAGFLLLVAFFIFLKKIIRTLFIILLVLGLGYYIFIYSNMLKPKTQHTKYSIYYLEQKYCTNPKTHKDSVYCFKIIKPIAEDFKNHYSEEEILKLERKPFDYYKAVNESIKRTKPQITQNLTNTGDGKFWQLFLKDLKLEYNTTEIAK